MLSRKNYWRGEDMKRLASFNIILLVLLVLVGFSFSTKIWADSGTSHQVFQTRPIQLGTSGGNINDISSKFCCSGTLGALVQNSSGTQFILSSNHILARSNNGIIGEDIIQPGLVDQACSQNAADTVANLSAFQTIIFGARTMNTIDAAIAQVVPGDVDPSGSILDIGQISSSIATPTLGMTVEKSGRTTGLTTGNISSINLTVKITYHKRCGIGRRPARFINQIGITPGSFSAAGDSGSLVVENVATCPRAVGLLFAGSSNITIANPIGDVLSALGVSMVGCSSSANQGKSLFRRIVALLFPSASAEQRFPVNSAVIANASQVKGRHEQTIMNIPGVVGMGVGLSQTVPNQVVIQVFVEQATEALTKTLPTQLEGVSVEIVETGEVVAF
jgi:hypothetical protein